ncbi:Putative lipooligosaccharide biosynthesis protein [Haemophilus influenzae]|uniref:Lipooligosaccharide biosynthesis protein n=1 Tax=Haemophilus influenzae TaxID=727 RepID=A0A2X1PKS6_HAEIF|nr:Putative lipooligosaccharide biosynthesis protein [Haemophilus influenzae]
MWENALIAIKEAPIFGHGSNGYEEFRHKQVKSKQMAKTTLNFGSLHNQYLESWVKRGLVGFIALILIILAPIFFFIKNLNTHKFRNKMYLYFRNHTYCFPYILFHKPVILGS